MGSVWTRETVSAIRAGQESTAQFVAQDRNPVLAQTWVLAPTASAIATWVLLGRTVRRSAMEGHTIPALTMGFVRVMAAANALSDIDMMIAHVVISRCSTLDLVATSLA